LFSLVSAEAPHIRAILADKSSMTQRREARYPADRQVEVVVFGSPDLRIPGRVHDASGRGIGLLLSRPLESGRILRINLEDAFLLGEVIYCRQQGEAWYAGVKLEHALIGLAELARSLSAFDDERSGSEYPDALKYARRQCDQ
jgi:hypothetical protein